tara:strand:+ start:1247 stop:1513 length:267 start_codon:yes stop_codon:yes gene_type:complete
MKKIFTLLIIIPFIFIGCNKQPFNSLFPLLKEIEDTQKETAQVLKSLNENELEVARIMKEIEKGILFPEDRVSPPGEINTVYPPAENY